MTDARRSLAEPTAYDQFLLAHGTPQMVRGREASSKKFEAELESGPPPTSYYRLISQHAGQLIAEVAANPSGSYPHTCTRFKLILDDHGCWRLDDYLWQCSCTDGMCDFCSGSGACGLCVGAGDCEICTGTGACKFCEGSKVCDVCSGSYMPGWNSLR